MTIRTLLPLTAALFLLAPGCTGEPPVPETAPPDTLRVMAYNIHHGAGMDQILDLERIAGLINSVRPDMVTLQEVDSVVARTGGVDQAGELARMTGMQPVFGRFMAYQGGAYGMAVLSRWPIVTSENIRLPDGLEPRTSVSATVSAPSGQTMRLVGIHFYESESERLAQATALQSHLDADPVPTILAGDFNSIPNSKVIDFMEAGWSILDKGEDRLTFSSFAPDREIDFMMFRPPGYFQVVHHDVLDEPVISDHRPVVADLIFRGASTGGDR
jgi:endonuclease/exonuclease/phosphatase family metal-dependent hydrolase